MTTFEKAIEELKGLVLMGAIECINRDWSFKLSSKAPESYKELQKYKVSKVIPIADYSSDTSVYGKNYNTLFRFWHDVCHLENDASFSKEGEYKAIDAQAKRLKEMGASGLAMRIFLIDTKGQVDYYFKHNEFVNDQQRFMRDCLKYGIEEAIQSTY